MSTETSDALHSFEQGPIRPPNEASSLLVRVTRNCPWNHCTFCPVYKGARFSLRAVEEVETDIAAMAKIARALEGERDGAARLGEVDPWDPGVQQVARFVSDGGRHAFLQDANSLLTPVEDFIRVLRSLRSAFPKLERVTTYARSHTICKRSASDLQRIREAGLDRIHVGMESGSDEVLALAKKGVTAKQHIEAGLAVKAARLSLSEYVMPGLGGRALSDTHARESARVLREIDPDFIRLRTLAIPPGSLLAELRAAGKFDPQSDLEIANELRSFVSGLDGITGTLKSDHILNLFEELEGTLPKDLDAMLGVLDRFLALPEQQQDAFIVGRRFGLLRRLRDLDDPELRAAADAALSAIRQRYPGPLDAAMRQAMTRFV